MSRSEPRHAGRSSCPSSSTSSDRSDDDGPDSIALATDQILSTKVARRVFTPPAVSHPEPNKERERLDRNPKDSDPRPQEPGVAKLPRSDPSGTQIALMNKPHIFPWVVAVLNKPEVSKNGKEKTEQVTDSAKPLRNVDVTEAFHYDVEKLQEMFMDMDKRLRSKDFKRHRAYKRCQSHTLQEVETRYLQLTREGRTASQNQSETRSKLKDDARSKLSKHDEENFGTRRVHIRTEGSGSPVTNVSPHGINETQTSEVDTEPPQPPYNIAEHLRHQRKFIKWAKKLFTFFLPLHFDSALVAKYWGAVYVLVEVNTPSTLLQMLFLTSRDQDFEKFRSMLPLFQGWEKPTPVELLGIITSDLTQGKAPQPWEMKIPDALGDAWLHLVMCLVLCADDQSHRYEVDEEFRACKSAVIRSKEEILWSLAPNPLQEREAVLPLGITSLVAKNLVNHGVAGQPDITSTYLEYLNHLVREDSLT